MTSVDFRAGGFDGAYRRRVGDYGHGDAAGADSDRGAPAAGDAGLGGRLGRLVNYVAAVVSVGLVIGLGVWGARLVSRDVSGVPVIRAMVGESRVAPDNPGGEFASHTGFAVNAVPAGRIEDQAVDSVAIAPPGAALTEDDLPMGEYGVAVAEPGALSDSIPAADALDPVVALQDSERRAAEAAAEARAAELAAEAEREAAAAVMADAPAIEAAANEAVTGLEGEEVDAGAISAALAEAHATLPETPSVMDLAAPGGLASSARPAARPARVSRAVAPAATPPAPVAEPARPVAAATPAPRPETAPEKPARTAAATPAAPQPASAPVSGAAVVQIGAFDSDAIARSEWDRIAGRAGGLFAGKGQIIQRHETNGRVFYRLRAGGFASTAEAQQFCADLKAHGTDCLAMKVN